MKYVVCYSGGHSSALVAVEAEKQIGHSIIKGIYLEELVPKFEEMVRSGICPNDKDNSNTFWAKVNKSFDGQQTILPCDCAVL